jgi:hypothetical protein
VPEVDVVAPVEEVRVDEDRAPRAADGHGRRTDKEDLAACRARDVPRRSRRPGESVRGPRSGARRQSRAAYASVKDGPKDSSS